MIEKRFAQPRNRPPALIEGWDFVAGHPLHELLFDPQTAGGLLIAVTPGFAEELVEDLRANGDPQAGVIGRILGGDEARLTWIGARV